MEPREERIGPLDCWICPGDPEAPTVVLLHGFGANAFDLMPLKDLLERHEGWTWVFPNAPLDLPLPFPPGGRAWWMIDTEAVARAMETGQHRDLTQKHPEGMSAAHAMFSEMLQSLKVPLSRLYLGGFSQGAILATDFALKADEKVAGLFILSGALLDQPNWEKGAAGKTGMPFFQSHGQHDALLPITDAQKLTRVLQAAGLEGSLLAFQGGHSIPLEVIEALADFLDGKAQRTEKGPQ